ncbi:ester hydrolase C11orf54 homolog [Contarinia nasturtii]|uniref:ester hydrolase C11orf54 homolog n=1 Tax=Contarinia nasturtii TaxID=265458 RepID=UPI0012D3CE1E|nr:ester hydrolase C11orf54 homolog [Contarinia nasturtii]XP_031640196.1 ester hydrolase C11orf54 homolog [Contarinia nasturtii]
MSAISVEKLQWKEKPLYVPSLSEMVTALSTGLSENFAEVSVEEVECPDLTAAPFHLASSGLSGSATIVDVGGPPFLLPLVDRTKIYDLVDIAHKVLPNAKDVYLCGAGAGPHPLIGSNCEGIFNLKVNEDGSVVNETHIARVTPGDELCDTQKVPHNETKFALMANLYVSEGQKGKVLHVKCKKRLRADNFITACQNAVKRAFADKHVGVGGVFILKNGNAHQHVMRDFSKIPLHTNEDVNNWLKFYEMPGILIALGTFVSDDMDLDLRLQHFHSFSKSNWGGHYHYDTTPNTIEYEAYFNVGQRIIRIDPPVVTHQVGRD